MSSTGRKLIFSGEFVIELPAGVDPDEIEIVGGTSTWVCPSPINVGRWNDEDDE